jgi:small subunit ribosomal protein S5
MSREETAYVEKLVAINRVAKVVKGGKRFSFSALVVVGDGKGRVGYSGGKAREVADAVKKASDRAKRFMIRVPMRSGRTLHHDAFGKFGAGKVVLRAAVSGTGIIAGGAMRSVFEALGMQDIVSKCIGSANPHNMVRATFDALQSSVSPKYIASKRGKKIGEITSRRSAAR